MTEETGPEEDYNSKLSWYLSTAGANGVISDVAVGYLGVTTVMLLLGIGVAGIQPLTLWLAGLGAFIALRSVAVAPTPSPSVSKTGKRTELVKDEVDTFDHPGCDQHGCDGEAERHVRGYEVYYLLGYEVSRSLTGENNYCEDHFAEHYPLDGLPVDEATVEASELEVEKVRE